MKKKIYPIYKGLVSLISHLSKYFAKMISEDYVKAAVKQDLTIHLQNSPWYILILMTGHEDIEATCFLNTDLFTKLESVPPIMVLSIHSQIPSYI